MEISKGIRIKDLCLVIGKTLVIPDIHMGYEEALNKQGFMLPRAQFDNTMKRLERILGGLEIETIVLIGDVKHEFGNISDT
ncbi:MAG: phosphoesterase, partial [Nanoarchaeota archaeon]